MNIRPTVPEDILGIQPAAHFEYINLWKDILGVSEAAPQLAVLSRAIEIDGHVVGIFGITPGIPGVGEIWFLLEPGAYEHPVAMAWAMKKLMPITWDSMHFHRLEATVQRGTPVEDKTIKLLEYHKFEREGLKVNWVPGKEHWFYAKQCQELQ
jgi:hypothetical protein